MAEKKWEDWTDADLTAEAQLGLRGQGAIVEMMRRLKESNKWLTRVNVFLAAAALIVAIAQFAKFLAPIN